MIPRPEHPRPDFFRELWLNLNGPWRFCLDPQNLGEQRRWYRLSHPDAPASASAASTPLLATPNADPFKHTILVPFPWESELSGVNATDHKGAAWYQRVVAAPADWPRDVRPFLCFGAVDWSAKVWVNGKFAGEHSGGYTPWAIDLTPFVTPGVPATLTVRVYDACDADTPLGKQAETWYTPSSGIWQTVWLEGRPAVHLESVHVATTDLANGEATVTVRVTPHEAPCRVSIAARGDDSAFPTAETIVAPGETEATLTVRVPNPRLWSPQDPHLYECVVRLETDVVQTYFGLRTVTRGRWENNPYEFVFLNNEPIYLRGALDQAFTPDGLHAYASDAAIRADVQLAKNLGLNMLRCHIKINDPRYYYWADKLGVLMMYDLPSASVYTPASRQNWEQTFRDALARDASHPSIFSWILFNETWGLEEHQTPASWRWVAQMYDLAKELDPTRLVEDNSACLYDHVKTDINTWHFYIADYDRARRHTARVVEQTFEGSGFNFVGHRYGHVEGAGDYKQQTEPFLNSEYAGLGASGGDKDISYTFKFLTTDLRRHGLVCGYVYTELSDIEWEHNGLVNYDRSAKEFGYDTFVPGMTIADLNGADFVGVDAPPCQTRAPGETFEAPAFVSHWDKRELVNPRLRWQATFVDRWGETQFLDENEIAVSPRRYAVTSAGPLAFTLPDEPALVTLALFLEDEHGVRARNYVNIDVFERAAPSVEETDNGWALRFRPADYADSSWPQPVLGPTGDKFGAIGAGWVEYAVPLPRGINDGQAVSGLRLVFEAAARTAASRVGWKRIGHISPTLNYPQTEENNKRGSDLIVSINGVVLGTVVVPDDPADARGVLSLRNGGAENFEYGSYGFLTTLRADEETALRILAAGSASELMVRFEVPRQGAAGGLNLFGARLGAFPVAPTLVVEREPARSRTPRR